MKIVIHTDGGARGNPGPAAVGVVVEEIQNSESRIQNKRKIIEFGKKIGETTNNVAEYTAVVEALKCLKSLVPGLKSQTVEPLLMEFFLDSVLVVQQLNGLFKVKDARLRELLTTVRLLEQDVDGKIIYSVIPREQNRRADFFVNQALDQPV